MARDLKKRPAKVQIIRMGKTSEYTLADETDWAIVFEDVLEIRATDGSKYYWPLASVTLWKVIPL